MARRVTLGGFNKNSPDNLLQITTIKTPTNDQGHPHMRPIATLLTLIPLLFSIFSAHAIEEEELLDPEEAFAVTLTPTDNQIKAQWEIAEGYYLYRNKIGFKSETPGVVLG